MIIIIMHVFVLFRLQMTNYYSMAICTPARASLMTGRYVVRYGLQYGLIEPGAPWSLPVTEKVRRGLSVIIQYVTYLGNDGYNEK